MSRADALREPAEGAGPGRHARVPEAATVRTVGKRSTATRRVIFLDIDGVLAPIRRWDCYGDLDSACIQVLNVARVPLPAGVEPPLK